MLLRQYIVLMPTEEPGAPVDILVESAPGTQAAPTLGGIGQDWAYYEWRGRPLRCPNPSGATTPNGQSAFIPRFRLGVGISIATLVGSGTMPVVELSESLGAFSSTDSGPTISVPTFADPAGGPCIRLTGSVDTTANRLLVTLMVPEAKDEDRDGAGT